jgi:hypothetical protein
VVLLAPSPTRNPGTLGVSDIKYRFRHWAGIVAYVIASAIAYYSSGVKPINGIIAASLLYFVLAKFIPQGREFQP